MSSPTETFGPPMPVDRYPTFSIRDLNRAFVLMELRPDLRSELAHFKENLMHESILAKRLAHPIAQPHIYRKARVGPVPPRPEQVFQSA